MGYVFFRDTFGAYSFMTWTVVALGVFCFVMGGFFAGRYSLAREVQLTFCEMRFPIRRFLGIAYGVYVVCAVIAVSVIFDYLHSGPETFRSFKSVRDAINFDFANNRYVFDYFRVFHFGVALSLFALTFASAFNRREACIIFSIGLLSALATTGRLFLLLYIAACAAILFKRKIIAARGLVSLFGVFGLVFFLIAVLFKKGTGQESFVEILVWNIQVYFFSPLAAFNSFVDNNFPHFDGGVLIPNAMKAILNKIGFEFEMRPPLMPFIEVPVRTNVYTSFFPLYHDGKLWGIGLGTAVFGFLHNTVYQWFRASESSVILYIFAVSLYPLLLTFFEDAYFSSPGFWVVIASPIVLFFIIQKVHKLTGSGKDC